MPRFALVSDAFADCFRVGRLWIMQFVANPVFLALFVAWLLIPVATGFQLVINVTVGLVLGAAFLVIHGGTLNYFSERQRGSSAPFWPPFRRALQHLLPFAIVAVVFCLLWVAVHLLGAYQPSFPAYLRSTLPVALRRHVSLATVADLFTAALFFARWVLVPGLVLPLFLQAADRGFRGFDRQGFSGWRKTTFSLAYWLVLLATALLGVLTTEKIMGVKPDFKTSTFHLETTSLVIRLTLAYLLGLFSWILACSTVGRYGAAARDAANVSGDSAA